MDASKILDAREERSKKVNKYIKKYQVVTLHANIPGDNKNLPIAYLLVNIFNKKLTDLYSPIKSIYVDSSDGPYYIFIYNKTKNLKDDLIAIEETPLGRFIDLDNFMNSEISTSRIKQRKCYLCGKNAHECSRNKTHTTNELLDYIYKTTYSYLKEYVSSLIKISSLKELDLTVKFGLVSPITPGSHNDMDYNLMNESINVIEPYITKIYISVLIK